MQLLFIYCGRNPAAILRCTPKGRITTQSHRSAGFSSAGRGVQWLALQRDLGDLCLQLLKELLGLLVGV